MQDSLVHTNPSSPQRATGDMRVFYWFSQKHFFVTIPTIRACRQRRKYEHRICFFSQRSEVALENYSREAGFAVSSLLLAGISMPGVSTVKLPLGPRTCVKNQLKD